MDRYIQVDVDLLAHPKVMRLCATLGDQRAWSYVVGLWLWAAKFAKDGSVGRYEPAEVEASLGWNGAEGALWNALVRCRLIDVSGDHQREIHDWLDGAGAFFAKRAVDAARKREGRARSRNHSNDVHGHPRTSTDVHPTAQNREERRGEEKRSDLQNPDTITRPSASLVLTRPGKPKPAADPDFESWWKAYPRKVGKVTAAKAWAKADRPALPEMLAALSWQVRQDSWTKDSGAFVPHPATYLNAGRWADEPTNASRPARVDYSAWDKPL